MTSTSPLIIEADGAVETWTLNLPETRNPISGDAMVEAIVSATERVNRDTEVRAVILTGAGSAFSAGGDVAAMASGAGLFGHPTAMQRSAYREGIQRIPRALESCEVPVVAAVNGPAVGAGCDLALLCDIRIATTTAFFAESFVRVGLVPGDGGAWLLPRVVGHARATLMALTGDRIQPDTALEWGLVTQVVEPDDLLPAAREVAGRIAANPPAVTRMTKKLLREAHNSSLDSVLELSAALQAIAHTTSDHREAVSAFMERREPRFTGQ